ncbi:MarR family winged helix-turn-helix transcriptional regulator [Gemmata sp. JC673]|uniref:MarR family winged helix-turn-helix transcriptional regulator n=1 Tax=Gemmata algarum TaxID=2975278 RepID=A0ABU5F2E3_9BACT|nr:MarR family winged helix-turn-helix transcriptional regulator [Gemmata algarum]MDY3561364.1 MarR family winged helix-turn-helix transcriptional regulator [Gemmata algarum]
MAADDPAREMAANCIAVRVRVLNRFVTALCETGLRGHGISVAQVNIMVVAGHAGPLTPTALSTALVMDKSTLSRDVTALLANGWLRKSEGPDRRSHTLELTTAGRDKLAAILPVWRQAQKDLQAQLGAENVPPLFDAVARVWAAGSD